MKKKLLSIAFVAALFVAYGCNSAGKTADKVKEAAEVGNVSELKLKVGGMTCTGCEKTIETGLSELEGVVNVDATFTDSLAIVNADTSKVSVEKIKTVVAQLGYSVIE